MDTKLEKQLADLAGEVGGKGPGAVYAVLHMLHRCYLAGKHNEFAKHCCGFSAIDGASLTASQPETGSNPGGGFYIN